MQSEAAAGVSKAKHFPGQTVKNSVPASDQMGERSSSDSKKKGPWTREEDQKLIAYIQEHGFGSWRTLPSLAGLQRCGKSCRLRWTNYLRPDIIRGKISSHEEKTIIRLHALLGNRWSAIAAHLPKRTDNEIKNYWNTRLKKRLTRMGIDPATHKPKPKSNSKALTLTLTHTAQWEEARLQAEARLRAQARRPPPPPCLDVLKVWQLIHHSQQLQFDPAIATSTPNIPLAAPLPNQYACGAGLGQLDCYADVMQSIPASYDGTELMGVPVPVEQLNQDYCGEFEDDKSFWNYLLNLVSSPIMESSPSPVLY